VINAVAGPRRNSNTEDPKGRRERAASRHVVVDSTDEIVPDSRRVPRAHVDAIRAERAGRPVDDARDDVVLDEHVRSGCRDVAEADSHVRRTDEVLDVPDEVSSDSRVVEALEGHTAGVNRRGVPRRCVADHVVENVQPARDGRGRALNRNGAGASVNLVVHCDEVRRGDASPIVVVTEAMADGAVVAATVEAPPPTRIP
jgi:hypothetical protein